MQPDAIHYWVIYTTECMPESPLRRLWSHLLFPFGLTSGQCNKMKRLYRATPYPLAWLFGANAVVASPQLAWSAAAHLNCALLLAVTLCVPVGALSYCSAVGP